MAARQEDLEMNLEHTEGLDLPGVGDDDDDFSDLEGADRGDEVVTEEPEEKAEEEQAEEQEPAEEEPAEEEEEEGEEDTDDRRIPKARFDEVLKERNQLREEFERLRRKVEELEQGKQAEPEPEPEPEAAAPEPYDFEAAEAKFAEAVINGDVEEAKRIRAEITRKQLEIAEQTARAEAAQVQNLAQMQVQFQRAVEELENQYPAFRPGDEAYDQEAVDAVLKIHSGLVAVGEDPVAALEQAATLVAAQRGLQPVGREEAPQQQAAPAKKPAVKQKLSAKEKQPPKQGGVAGRSVDDLDLDNLSEEEFDALPEATKARLRGDIL